VGLQRPKIAEIGNFWYIFAQKEYTPLSDFYKIWLVEKVIGSHRHAKFHHCGSENVGMQPPKSPKLVFSSINLPKRVYPLKRFYKIWFGRGSPSLHLHAKFHRCGCKNVGLQPPKSRKMVIFLV